MRGSRPRMTEAERGPGVGRSLFVMAGPDRHRFTNVMAGLDPLLSGRI